MSSSTDELVRPDSFGYPDAWNSVEILNRANQCVRSSSKRCMDIALSFLALVVLSPILVLISCGIFVQDRGPVFFRQDRTGRNGDVFRIWKFRTMAVQPKAASFRQTTGRNDPRVTTLGRWLRMSSLDELPQLINILKGDMSLVGPRPHPVDLDRAYAHKIKDYGLRQSVRPGLTGSAQINGIRGAVRSLDDMEKRIELDLFYITNWSLFGDVVILFLTLNLRKITKNAY